MATRVKRNPSDLYFLSKQESFFKKHARDGTERTPEPPATEYALPLRAFTYRLPRHTAPDACRGSETGRTPLPELRRRRRDPENAQDSKRTYGRNRARTRGTEEGRNTAEVVVGSPDGGISEAGKGPPGERHYTNSAGSSRNARNSPRTSSDGRKRLRETAPFPATSPIGVFSSSFFPRTCSGPPRPSVPQACRAPREDAWTHRGSGQGGRRGSRFVRWTAPGCGANAP